MTSIMSPSSDAAPIGRTAEYALRAMAEIAAEPGGALRAVDLAAKTRVPAHYLSKVLRRLVKANLLRSRKGHGGGFVLSRPSSQICFADVLRAVGSELESSRCAFGYGHCNLQRPCRLHPAWWKLKDALGRWARETTLSSLRFAEAPAKVPREALTRPRRTRGIAPRAAAAANVVGQKQRKGERRPAGRRRG
jgi:Rrf2 family protein